jgi:hypothetical protein
MHVLRSEPALPDYEAFVRYREQVVFRRRFWTRLAAVPLLILAAGLFEAWRLGGLRALLAEEPAAVLAPLVGLLWVAGRWRGLRRKAERMARAELPGERAATLEPDALVVDTPQGRRRYDWSGLVDLVETGGLLLFVHKSNPHAFKATMVPLRGDPLRLAAFQEAARGLFLRSRPRRQGH